MPWAGCAPFNYCLRKLGLKPARPGTRPRLEVVKAGSMKVVIPAAKGLKNTFGKAMSRQRIGPK